MASRSGRSWESLSGAYRDRLAKAGISRSGYESGESVQVARGHREREHAYTRLRAEILPLLEGLPQRDQLERKLRKRELDPRGVRDLAVAAKRAQTEWQDRGGDQGGGGGGGGGPIGGDLGATFDDIYELWDWPDDDRDVPAWYHGEGD